MALQSLRDQTIECNALLQQIQADVNVLEKTLDKLMEKQNELQITMSQILSEKERTSYQSRKRKMGSSTIELGDPGRQEGAEAAASDPHADEVPPDEDVTQTLVVTGVVDWPMLGSTNIRDEEKSLDCCLCNSSYCQLRCWASQCKSSAVVYVVNLFW